jgi:hypothetical protein
MTVLLMTIRCHFSPSLSGNGGMEFLGSPWQKRRDVAEEGAAGRRRTMHHQILESHAAKRKKPVATTIHHIMPTLKRSALTPLPL